MKYYLYKFFPNFAKKCARLKRKIIIFIHRKYSFEQMEKYINKKYFQVHGYKMDWKNPKSYTQKIQYSKLYNCNSLKTICSDKIAVRDYVKTVIGEEYLIPIYGVWEKFDEIDFKNLPNKFILKTNHGSATNIIVNDKRKIDIKKVKRKMNNFLNDDFAYYGFELHYSGIKPLIFAEELLDFGDSNIEDYKFLCFDGKIHYFWVDFNRNTNHKRNMYDLEWNLLEWNQWHYGNYTKKIEKPKNFDEMIEIVQKLSAGFDHVRVDLYNINGKIYFGELTFTNGGGYEPIYPREMDYELGKLWNLQNYNL